MRHGVGVQVSGHEAREVGHVGEEVGPHGVGDLAEEREVELPRVGRPAGDDELRPVLLGEPRHLVHVDPAVLGAHVVGHDVVQAPGHVLGHAVGRIPYSRPKVTASDMELPEERTDGKASCHLNVLLAEPSLQVLGAAPEKVAARFLIQGDGEVAVTRS